MIYMQLRCVNQQTEKLRVTTGDWARVMQHVKSSVLFNKDGIIKEVFFVAKSTLHYHFTNFL